MAALSRLTLLLAAAPHSGSTDAGDRVGTPIDHLERSATMRGFTLLASAVVVTCSSLANAQTEEPTPLTWVRYFTVEPGHSDEFKDLILEYDAPIFDKLIEDGNAVTWGMLSPFTRTGEDWTHAIWITAPSWESYDKLMEGFMTAEEARTESQNKKIDDKFLGIVDVASIHDKVFRHQKLIDSNADDPEPHYIRFGFYRVKPEHADGAADLYGDIAGPVYAQLDEQGVINAAGLAAQEIVTTSDYTHLSWTVVPSLGSFDKIDAAFMEAKENRSPGDQERMETFFAEGVDHDAYRSTICIITHFKKADH
jgi:hypothetical protein